jgi:hypothetical protein
MTGSTLLFIETEKVKARLLNYPDLSRPGVRSCKADLKEAMGAEYA